MFAAFAADDSGAARPLRYTVAGLVAAAIVVPLAWTAGIGLLVDAPSPGVRFGPILALMVVLPAWTATAAGFELSGDGTPRRVAALAALAAVPWLALSLVFSPAQVVAVPLLFAAVCYAAQGTPTRDLPVAQAWTDARLRFARAALVGRPYRWRVALLAAPGVAAIASVVAIGVLVRWLGTIEGAGLEVLLVPLVVLFLVPLGVGWTAAAALPVARGPMVRYLRGFFAHTRPTRALAGGPTVALLVADLVLLVTVVCWGATTFLGAYSPIGTISLVLTLLGLLPAVIARLVLADVAVLRGGDTFDTAVSAVAIVAHHPLELVRLVSVQLAVASLTMAAVLLGPGGLLILAWFVGNPFVAAASVVATGVLGWFVVPPVAVLLALHRLGTLARCLEPSVGPDTPTQRIRPRPPASPPRRSTP